MDLGPNPELADSIENESNEMRKAKMRDLSLGDDCSQSVSKNQRIGERINPLSCIMGRRHLCCGFSRS